MAQPIRTERFVTGLYVDAATLISLAVVPPGMRWAVKYYALLNNDSVAHESYLDVVNGSTFLDSLHHDPAQPAGSVASRSVYHVLEEGDELVAFFTTNSASGFLLNISGMAFEL